MTGSAQYARVTSARVTALALVALLAFTPALAGCIAKRPTIVVDVHAGTSGLDDFASFEITVRRIYVQQEGRNPQFFEAGDVVIDLVASSASSRVTSTPLEADSYEKVGIELATLRATKLDGSIARVSYFNNLLYFVSIFRLGAGETKTLDLALSVQPNRETGDLILVTVASESTLK